MSEKRCCRCSRTLPISMFPRKGGKPHKRRGYCRECDTAARQRRKLANLAAYLERKRISDAARRKRPGHNEHMKARNKVYRAVREGLLRRPETCERCNSAPPRSDNRSAIEAHHRDYDKPLEVMWLCRLCHKAEHRMEMTNG